MVTANGNTYSVKDVKSIRAAEAEPKHEIRLAKRKKAEQDKLS